MLRVLCRQFLNQTAASAPLDSRREESGSHIKGGQYTEVGGSDVPSTGGRRLQGVLPTLVTALLV